MPMWCWFLPLCAPTCMPALTIRGHRARELFEVLQGLVPGALTGDSYCTHHPNAGLLVCSRSELTPSDLAMAKSTKGSHDLTFCSVN
jgi:hypothetical protein